MTSMPTNPLAPPVLPTALRVLLFPASLRDESYNKLLALCAEDVLTDAGAVVNHKNLADWPLPLYNQDIQDEVDVAEFAADVKACDAMVIVSPEYNASIPGGLKNLIDWASRVHPQPFARKQVLLMSASPSMVGGNRGLWALRVPLEHLGARVYPEMFSLAQAHEAFAPDGKIADVELGRRFVSLVNDFLALVEADVRYPCTKLRWTEFPGEKPDPATDRVE